MTLPDSPDYAPPLRPVLLLLRKERSRAESDISQLRTQLAAREDQLRILNEVSSTLETLLGVMPLEPLDPDTERLLQSLGVPK